MAQRIGHRMVFGTLPGYAAPVSFFVDPDRMRFPPIGLAGGHNGPVAEILVNGERIAFEDWGTDNSRSCLPATASK